MDLLNTTLHSNNLKRKYPQITEVYILLSKKNRWVFQSGGFHQAIIFRKKTKNTYTDIYLHELKTNNINAMTK